MTERDQAVERQAAIWANLYGPARAGTMVEALVQLRAERPELAWREAVDVVDPEEAAEFEDFVATRR